MKALLLAPFLLPRRAILTRSLNSGDKWDVDNLDRSALMIDRHKADGAMRLSQQRQVEHLDLANGGEVRIYLGAVSIGCCVIEIEAEDQASMHALELRLLEELRPGIANVATRLGNAMDKTASEPRGSDPADVPHSQLLWWHRVLIDPDFEPRATEVFGTPFQLRGDCDGSLGSGFTVLRNPGQAEVRDVVAGLLAANEEWLLVDEMNRRLGKAIVVTGAPTDRRLGQALDLAIAVEAEAALTALVIDERRRLLAPAELTVYRAALANWSSDEERATMLSRADHVRGLLTLASERSTAARDERRNRLILAITVVTLMQVVLAVLDFAVGGDLSVVSTARLAISTTTILLGSALLLSALRSSRTGS